MDDVKAQLAQMQTALELASEEDKPEIELIINQLQELLGAYSSEDTAAGPATAATDNIGGVAQEENDDEYKQFQAEIAALNSSTSENETCPEEAEATVNGDNNDNDNETETVAESIGSDLEALIGMKCMAPHQANWGQIGYYNAMISSVLSLENDKTDTDEDDPSDLSSIMVRVMFLQPVVKSQLLCPFYKEDRCRFSDAQCKFSHGEVVPLSQLREYSEPDFSLVVPGCRVFAKYHDDLWYKATVQQITVDGECEVLHDVGKEVCVIPLHETVPLNQNESSSSSDLSSSDEDDVENPGLSTDSEAEEFPKTLLGNCDVQDIKSTSVLGEWEKYTKGVGSRLMQKMGYVMGTGLGKNQEGRVEPVDAIVLPPGKSLDACMALKEKAHDGNLFSAEKRRLKQQRKVDKQRAKVVAHQKSKKEESTVFEFLNSKLALRKTDGSRKNEMNDNEKSIRKETTSHLNKRLFGLSESLKQVSKDISKTKESMKRQREGRDKETLALLEKKLEALESKRRDLNQMQISVTREQKLRSDKRKLDLF